MVDLLKLVCRSALDERQKVDVDMVVDHHLARCVTRLRTCPTYRAHANAFTTQGVTAVSNATKNANSTTRSAASLPPRRASAELLRSSRRLEQIDVTAGNASVTKILIEKVDEVDVRPDVVVGCPRCGGRSHG